MSAKPYALDQGNELACESLSDEELRLRGRVPIRPRDGDLGESACRSEKLRLRGQVPVRFRDAELVESTRWAAALVEARAQAAELLVQAQEEADALLAQATTESQALRNQAREEGRTQGHREGYKAGYAEGLAAGRAELMEHLHAVYQLADEAATAKAAVIAGAEAEIAELVIETARKVIGEVVDLNPDVVVNLVANAIKYANTGDVLTIRVNPRDVELLHEYWAEALDDDNPGGRRWEIIADRRVKPGGCVIDTPSGTVDARVDTQLVQIKYAFDKVSANEPHD